MNIPHNRPTFSRKEKLAVRKTIDSNWVTQGKNVAEFEEKFCSYLGLPSGHSVAVSSGSAALYLAMHALDVIGKKIGLPVYTCAALNNSVALAGGKPFFVDNDLMGPNLDIDIAKKAELDTLIAVSTFGIPLSISSDRRYRVIEDISQALGTEVKGKKIGLRGEVGVCSFSATKLITSGGQGGMVFSNDKRLIDSIRDYREFDAREDGRARFNFQMTDIQAAIGIIQLAKLPSFLQKRQEIFNVYTEHGLQLIRETDSNQLPSRYRAVIRNASPEVLQKKLFQKGISTIIPYSYDELLSKSINEINSINLSKSTLSIPIYPSLTLRETKRIAQTVELAIESL
jgi:perosamine synthetase